MGGTERRSVPDNNGWPPTNVIGSDMGGILHRREENCKEVPRTETTKKTGTHGDAHARRTGLPLYIATLTQGLNVFDTTQELPSYEQAISMSSTPSPNPVSASTGNERLPPYKAPSSNRVLRVAPERPGALPTIVLPPSYESSIGDSPIYTVSSTVGHTPL